MFKRLVRRFKRWNKWRRRCLNGRAYKTAVLLGLVESPTFGIVMTDEEEEEIHQAVMRAILEEMKG